MRVLVSIMVALLFAGLTSTAHGAEKIRALIIDGLNPYHDWQVTSPLMKQILEDSGHFEVDIATVPIPPGYQADLSGPPQPIANLDFHPDFSKYDVVIGNYIGPRWPAATEREFVKFVEGGKGFVVVHSADNAFPDWPEYSRMCGVGGWYGRTEKSGPHVYLDDQGKEVRDTSAGSGGHHGPQHEYEVTVRDAEHPITKGMPAKWLHAKDELYDTLRGPATDMHILATAYSDPQFDGTGKHEPVIMVLPYGAGRVFHTVLGHADYSMNCPGFAAVLLRGTEWAAIGDVTVPLPKELPTAAE
jgi:type 1 glutamine amidotransferase